MLSRLFIAAMWSHAGKGLTSWLIIVVFNFDFVTYPCGALGQVWYLIVLIPDLCRLSYFDKHFIAFVNQFNEFEKTGSRMIDSIYHMKINFLWICVYGMKKSIQNLAYM